MGRIGGDFDANRAFHWLGRRGPDSHKTWRSDQGEVSLLHCRLAIVDQDDRSHQPFRDANHGVVVAFNGEIYNYRQLRRHFADYAFCSASDTEVIIAAYVKEGLAGFKRLNGMFSLVLVDERRRRVIVARDPVGKKPLFIFGSPGNLLFGSSLLALVACSGIEPTIDAKAASFYWRRGYISPDTAALVGAEPVPPGIAVEFDYLGNELSRTRIEPSPSTIYRGESIADVKRTIHELLLAAVADRLENNPHPAVLLSGGIDSTLVTDLIRQSWDGSRRPLRVITLGSMIPQTQDEYYARYAAKRLKLHLEIVHPVRRRLSDAVRHAISLQDEPLAMPSYFLLVQLVSAAAEHARVLITGDGGDEVFFGYRPFADWQLHQLNSADQARVVQVGPEAGRWMGSWARDVIGNTLLGHMFTKLDRASAEQAVEIRCPLLDLSLMSYVRSLPPDILSEGASSKQFLKDQLSGWPSWFLNRRKLGFAYNLRWHWALTRFAGLREMISEEAIATFADRVARSLQAAPPKWNTYDIFKHFGEAWRLMVWSAFLDRFEEAKRMSRSTVARMQSSAAIATQKLTVGV